ncbi:MAG: FAD-dependent oxidoreductase [Pseudomonadota bacterium]
MDTLNTDILIIGGGLAGLAAAARFAAAGQHAVVVDPSPDVLGGGDDLRTTAILQPGIDTLSRAGAWDAMRAAGTALETMRLVDAGGRERRARKNADFTARDLGHAAFGWNVPNQAARAALRQRVDALPEVTLVPGTRLVDLTARSAHVLARLDDGRWIDASLAIGADGRDSAVRSLAGIGRRRWHYAQRALVFAVYHAEPHAGVSTEIHRTGGPLTLVPMPDRDGRPCSSIVWMMPGPRAAHLAGLDDQALAAELTTETMGLFGTLEVAGPRASWPIISQVAERLIAKRVALIAEAAHVVPPIGAQGLNMSLADVECLARLIEGAGAGDIASPALLAKYEARRMPEILARVAGVDLLNRFAQTELQPLRDLRLLGLRAISEISPLRHLAMRLGLGAPG